MKVGLLSDTHGDLDPKIFEHFHTCDEIWHAGDIGSASVADKLKAFRPFRAVYGNIDDKAIRAEYPEDLWIRVEGLEVLMTHIAGTPPRFNPRVRALLADTTPGLLICGHSHILQVARDETRGNMLYINPGAAGNHGFHRVKTLVRFEITAGKIANLEVIEIGKRGALV